MCQKFIKFGLQVYIHIIIYITVRIDYLDFEDGDINPVHGTIDLRIAKYHI